MFQASTDKEHMKGAMAAAIPVTITTVTGNLKTLWREMAQELTWSIDFKLYQSIDIIINIITDRVRHPVNAFP